MQERQKKVLAQINLYFTVKKYLIIFSYSLIIIGGLSYVFFSFSKINHHYKMVSNYNENNKKFTMEKTMVNPRIKFQYNNDEIYDIHAEKASHKNDANATLINVYASGKIGTITAGELDISENGDHLIFKNNPVVVLNKGGLNE